MGIVRYNIMIGNNSNNYKVKANLIKYNILNKNGSNIFNRFLLYKRADNIYYSIRDMIYGLRNVYYGINQNIIYENNIGFYFINKLIGWIKFEVNKGIICKSGYVINFKNNLRNGIDRNKVIIEYSFKDNVFTIYYNIKKDKDSYICESVFLKLSQGIRYSSMISHYCIHLDSYEIIEKVNYVYANNFRFKHEKIGIIMVNSNEFFIKNINKILEYNRFINTNILN